MANPNVKIEADWKGVYFKLPHKQVTLPLDAKGECTLRELSKALKTVLDEGRCDG